MRNDFLGYPDPRPYRTFANIRYALYEYWLRHYSDNSYILILDFRDTFFQANPFGQYGAFSQRTEPKYDLQMYAENYKVCNSPGHQFNVIFLKQKVSFCAKFYPTGLPLFLSVFIQVKNIGICVFNSNWIKTCFGKPALDALRKEAVICSGSTLGSFPAVKHYVRTMLSSMDTVKCWLKGIESDQVKK